MQIVTSATDHNYTKQGQGMAVAPTSLCPISTFFA